MYNLLIFYMLVFYLSSYAENFWDQASGLYPGFVTSCFPLSKVWFYHLYTEDTYFLDLFENKNLKELICVQCFVSRKGLWKNKVLLYFCVLQQNFPHTPLHAPTPTTALGTERVLGSVWILMD